MAPLWMLLLAIAADPEKPGQAVQAPPPVAQPPQSRPNAPRTGRALSDAAQAALRRWARPADREAEDAARDFLVLYEELTNDQSLGVTTRQQLRLKVRTRLAQLAEQIAKRAGKGDRLAGMAQDNGDAPSESPEKLSLPADRPDRLAQLGGGRARGAPGAKAVANRNVGSRRARPQNFGPPDAGQDLVELIQQTIAPSTWDVSGGPGTIRYWRPGAALVIRQTTEVHEDISDFVKQLQR